MAKDIKFNGNVFSNVPRVQFLQQNDNWVGFDDTTDATATAEDIAQGKTAYVNGQKVTGIASGSSAVIEALNVTTNGMYTAPSGVDGYSPVNVNVDGGASNFVSGTFKGTSQGALDINIPYSGSGYPIAGIIYPSGGSWVADSMFNNLKDVSAIQIHAFTKADIGLTPDYNPDISGRLNEASSFTRYKSSNTSATQFSNASGTASRIYSNTTAKNSNTEYFYIKNAKTLSVYIGETLRHFAIGIEYTYHIIYSS